MGHIGLKDKLCIVTAATSLYLDFILDVVGVAVFGCSTILPISLLLGWNCLGKQQSMAIYYHFISDMSN